MTQSEAPAGSVGVAFDVAVRHRHFAGRAQKLDCRDFIVLEVPELPWELRFYFVTWMEDGETGTSCVGFELGSPISDEAAATLDVENIETTAARMEILWKNFARYREIAQAQLWPTPANVDHAVATRDIVRRRKHEPWTNDRLVSLIRDLRSAAGSTSQVYDVANLYDMHRSSIVRALDKAVSRGLLSRKERIALTR